MTFFRKFFNAMTRNWGLKLISLLLAIALYYAFKPSNGLRTTTHDTRPLFQTP